jgi:hypothetical protein
MGIEVKASKRGAVPFEIKMSVAVVQQTGRHETIEHERNFGLFISSVVETLQPSMTGPGIIV